MGFWCPARNSWGTRARPGVFRSGERIGIEE
jgi:hypothetical protein